MSSSNVELIDDDSGIMYTEEPKYKRIRAEEDESRKISLTKKSFNPNWLKFSMFKDWLLPHKLTDKAVCKVCHCVLVAGKSELEKHLATRKHERNMEKINGSPAEQGDEIETYTIISADAIQKQNIQVQSEIKSTDNAETHKQSADEDDIAIEEVLTPLRIKQESAANRAHMMKRKRGLQKYRTDWEKLSEFRGWLSPEPKSCYKARCEACDKSLVADITVLRNHSQAKKHVMKTGGTVYEGPIVRNKSKAKSEDDDEDSPDELQMKSLSIKDNDDDYEVGLQSNDYHSTTNYEKMDQKHDDIQCRAIVSKPAPFWKATAVVNGHVTELKLSDYNGRYLVLFFYPQDFSRICPSELIALSDRVSEFRALNTEVVACSVDSYLSHQAWSRTLRSDGGIAIPKMPLLSDPTHTISKSYGCYLSELGHSLRAHYIIDMRGILRHVTINDLPVGRNIGEILRLLEAFQYTDETETLCPADWKPGEPTIS